MSSQRILRNVKYNLQQTIDLLLLQEGLYNIVSSGELDYNGIDMSKLVISDDPNFIGIEQAWQSAFNDWVFESGISGPSGFTNPSVASGIIVDGVFYEQTTTTGTFAHHIDYINGRIIFDTAISTSSIVQVEFTYKDVHVDFESRFNNENMIPTIATTLKDNPITDVELQYPSGEFFTLPAVFIETPRRSWRPYGLGGGKIGDQEATIHVYAKDDDTRDDIIDYLTRHEDANFTFIDVDLAPILLDEFGGLASGSVPYKDMREDPSLFWKNVRFLQMNYRNINTNITFEHSIIDAILEISFPEL